MDKQEKPRRELVLPATPPFRAPPECRAKGCRNRTWHASRKCEDHREDRREDHQDQS